MRRDELKSLRGGERSSALGRVCARAWGTLAGPVAGVAVAWVAGALVCLTGNFGSDFWWPDAPRHAMDGVFILDFVRAIPWGGNPYEYAVEYYARYPCLGLVHYPPVFAAVEAVVFAALGISVESARVAVALFGGLAASFAYALGRRLLGRFGGIVAALLVVTAPELALWGREVMLEVPVVAMMLGASYFLIRYLQEERAGFAVAASAFLALGILTKQTACVVVPAFVAYAVWRCGWRVLVRREVLIAAAVFVAIVLPYAVVTVLLCPVNVGQSIGSLKGEFDNPRLSLASALFYIRGLPKYTGVLGLVGLAALGIGLGVRHHWPRARSSGSGSHPLVFFALWAGCCYAVFSFVIALKTARLFVVAVPALAMLSAWGWRLVKDCGRIGRWAAHLGLGVLLVQFGLCLAGRRYDPWAEPAPLVSGTADLSEELVRNEPGTVLYYGRFNGNFVFDVRRLAPRDGWLVLRASKMLFSMPGMQTFGLTVHAGTEAQIRRVFTDYGVRYVAVEDRAPSLERYGAPGEGLRSVLQADDFKLLSTHRVASNVPALRRNIRLYEFANWGPARAKYIAIRTPIMGTVLKVPMARLRPGARGSAP